MYVYRLYDHTVLCTWWYHPLGTKITSPLFWVTSKYFTFEGHISTPLSSWKGSFPYLSVKCFSCPGIQWQSTVYMYIDCVCTHCTVFSLTPWNLHNHWRIELQRHLWKYTFARLKVYLVERVSTFSDHIYWQTSCMTGKHQHEMGSWHHETINNILLTITVTVLYFKVVHKMLNGNLIYNASNDIQVSLSGSLKMTER